MAASRRQPTAVLTIAGSDPSGGAGIQADLKTFSRIGVYGGAVLTCLTVQNTQGVFHLEPVSPDLVLQQIEAVLQDLPISHIKTGMLASGAICAAVAEALRDYRGELICDPVLQSSSGHDLLDPAGQAVFRDQLLPRATVLTPNLPELNRLTERHGHSPKAIAAAVRELFHIAPQLRVVMVTGGHMDQPAANATDLCFIRPENLARRPDPITSEHPRLHTRNDHGTGCTFAAAFTGFHLLSGDDQRAFHQASEMVWQLLEASAATKMGHGQGPLQHHLYPPRA